MLKALKKYVTGGKSLADNLAESNSAVSYDSSCTTNAQYDSLQQERGVREELETSGACTKGSRLEPLVQEQKDAKTKRTSLYEHDSSQFPWTPPGRVVARTSQELEQVLLKISETSDVTYLCSTAAAENSRTEGRAELQQGNLSDYSSVLDYIFSTSEFADAFAQRYLALQRGIELGYKVVLDEYLFSLNSMLLELKLIVASEEDCPIKKYLLPEQVLLDFIHASMAEDEEWMERIATLARVPLLKPHRADLEKILKNRIRHRGWDDLESRTSDEAEVFGLLHPEIEFDKLVVGVFVNEGGEKVEHKIPYVHLSQEHKRIVQKKLLKDLGYLPKKDEEDSEMPR
ncbi:hypothetical protein D6774_04235 [Candidatus Woesearchaeota archaeon]|nr:MAG: hypothetical protein D6774_04235 [Candidatus Woesearchaeota archaeon]